MKDLITISIGTMVRVAQCSWAKIALTHYPYDPLFASLLKQWSKCFFLTFATNIDKQIFAVKKVKRQR